MESYIIRVYHRDEKDMNRIVGLAEEVGAQKRAFHSLGELNSIIIGKTPDTEHHKEDRRRSERLKLRLPVRLKGTNIVGENFIEDTILNDLSPRGAFFCVHNPVTKDTKLNLLIDPDRSHLNVEAKVVRIEDENGRKGIGVSF